VKTQGLKVQTTNVYKYSSGYCTGQSRKGEKL